MKKIKLFEDFKTNNKEGSLISKEDIIECIKSGGVIYTTSIKDFPGNPDDNPITPVNIDDDGLITVEVDSDIYYVDIENVNRIEF